MFFDFIFFPFFAYFIVITGMGFFRVVNSIIGIDCQHIHLSCALLFGIFSIGCISFIVNFFSAINNSFIYSIVTVLFLIGLPDIRRYTKREHAVFFSFIIIFVPLASSMDPGYDAGLYHLPHQLWIRDHKIVFGLANLHGRFGFSSLQEYISAPLWVYENFKLLSYISNLYIISFFLFLWSYINIKNSYVNMLILFLLLSLPMLNNVVSWTYYTYTDYSAGLLFVLSFLAGIQLLMNDSNPKKNRSLDLFLFSFFALFALMLKPSTVFIVLWVIFILTCLLISRKTNFFEIVRLNLIWFFILVLWLFRGLIITGCLFYPSASTCMNLPWSAKAKALGTAKWITAWARHPRAGLYSLDDWSWLTNWWLSHYSEFLIKLSITILTLIVLAFLLRHLYSGKKLFSWLRLSGFLFVFFSLAFWFINAPTPRFGIGPLLLFPSMIAFLALGKIKKAPGPKYGIVLKTLLLFTAIFLSIRATDFKALHFHDLYRFKPLTVSQPKVKEHNQFGVKPIKGDRCWLVPDCAPYDRPTPKEIYGYLFFKPAKGKR